MGGEFYVGFVFGDTDVVDLEEPLGKVANREHSLGIQVYHNNTFYLWDKDNKDEELPSSLPLGARFPVRGQQWLIEFDFAARSLALFLRMQTQWARAFNRELTHSHVVPAFSLYYGGDEIEIV